MGPPTARPRVAELVFRLYDRPLHPELFEGLATRRVERAGYRVAVHVTRTGHVLEWSSGPVGLTELTAAAGHDLPVKGQRLAHKMGGGRSGRCDLDGGVRYRVGSQVEVLPPEQFRQFHEELCADGARKGLLYHFPPDARSALPPLGVVVVEELAGGLSVAAFHTFPAELAVVKTQSLIERA